MQQPLPHSKFRFLTKGEINKLDFDKINEFVDGGFGYIIEASFSYPKNLHKKHRSWPLLVEKKTITESMLSPYSRKNLKKIYGKTRFKEVKVTSTLSDKNHAVISLANFKLYQKLGLKLKKIHRVLEFYQSSFAKPYIEKCTENRMLSTSAYEMALWKLLSNALYGKVTKTKLLTE